MTLSLIATDEDHAGPSDFTLGISFNYTQTESDTGVVTLGSMYKSYGWPVLVLFGAMWLRFLVVGGLCFAGEPVEPNLRNILMRRPTAYEHRIVMEMTFMVGIYVPFDFYCIKEGSLRYQRQA